MRINASNFTVLKISWLFLESRLKLKKKELEKKEESLAQYEQSGYDIGVKEIEDALGLRSQESAVGIVFRYGLKH